MIRKAAAEFVGTFALVFFGCGSIAFASLQTEPVSFLLVPISFGAIVATMIYALGHISGAHFNPAVSIAFFIGRHFPARELAPYIVAQVLAATLAAFVLKLLLPEAASIGPTLPQVGFITAMLWEFLLTFFLMFVIMSVATDTRAVGTMAGAAIGMMVALGALVGGPFTGASMNPARSIGPAIAEFQFDSLWIYMICPIAGAAAAASIYEIIRCAPETTTDNAKGCC